MVKLLDGITNFHTNNFNATNKLTEKNWRGRKNTI